MTELNYVYGLKTGFLEWLISSGFLSMLTYKSRVELVRMSADQRYIAIVHLLIVKLSLLYLDALLSCLSDVAYTFYFSLPPIHPIKSK